MAEGGELMSRLLSENADLKKQVRLLKENQMLRRLLSQSCQEGGGHDLLPPRAPAYPEAGSPGNGVPDFGRFASVADTPSQLQTSSLEDLLCSHAPLSSEDDTSPGCAAPSQSPFKAFLSPPELHSHRGTDRKLSPLLSPLQDSLVDKTLLEPREMVRPKKVCFSESSLPTGDRTRRSYYLNTSIKSLDGSVDEKKLRELTQRYLALSARLEKLGYSRDVHPAFSEFLINTYGILKQRPDLRANPLHSSPAALRKLVIDVVPPKFLGDSLLLLNCLCELSKEDSKPLFAW
uniref:Spermatogenesis and centriole associated 1 like n=1 Tax=Colobus angolensis palliatus TaxID=336983 RepID=A0A2K5HT58_COLAP